LRSIDDNDVNKLMAEVPPARMTKICREFTLRLLTENQRRLLEGRFDE
jgi:hypothetical protein